MGFHNGATTPIQQAVSQRQMALSTQLLAYHQPVERPTMAANSANTHTQTHTTVESGWRDHVEFGQSARADGLTTQLRARFLSFCFLLLFLTCGMLVQTSLHLKVPKRFDVCGRPPVRISPGHMCAYA